MKNFSMKFLRVLQFLWVLPIFFAVGLVYILPMWIIFRDLVFKGCPEFLVFEFGLADKNVESWHVKLWEKWGGWASAPFVIFNIDYDLAKINLAYADDCDKLRIHELKHIEQQFWLGICYHPAYFLMLIWIYFFKKEKHPYYDCPFERDARAAAGQDVEVSRDQWAWGPDDSWPWW